MEDTLTFARGRPVARNAELVERARRAGQVRPAAADEPRRRARLPRHPRPPRLTAAGSAVPVCNPRSAPPPYPGKRHTVPQPLNLAVLGRPHVQFARSFLASRRVVGTPVPELSRKPECPRSFSNERSRRCLGVTLVPASSSGPLQSRRVRTRQGSRPDAAARGPRRARASPCAPMPGQRIAHRPSLATAPPLAERAPPRPTAAARRRRGRHCLLAACNCKHAVAD